MNDERHIVIASTHLLALRAKDHAQAVRPALQLMVGGKADVADAV